MQPPSGFRSALHLLFLFIAAPLIVPDRDLAGQTGPAPNATMPGETINISETSTDDLFLNGPDLSSRPKWSEILRAVALTAIPDQYEDSRQWGKTRRIFDGFRMKQRGFDIRISDRRRTVNDGAWQRYKVELIDRQKALTLTIGNVQSIGEQRYRFDLMMAAKLRCRADFEHWLLGVKGFNVTVVSEADVKIVANCQLGLRTEFPRGSLIPDIILEPRVNDVKLDLTHLDVTRIGEIRGDLAEGLGDSSRMIVENLIHAQEDRVQRKLNEALDKKRDSLRLSARKLWKF